MLKAIISSLTVSAAPRGGSGQGQGLGLPLATTPGLLAAVCDAGSSPVPGPLQFAVASHWLPQASLLLRWPAALLPREGWVAQCAPMAPPPEVS